MRKSHAIGIALCLAFISQAISARQISTNEALEKAMLFGKKATTSRLMAKSTTSQTMSLAYAAKEKESDSEGLFYVFNRGSGDGFVIISGEDKTNEILGYSDTGSFDYNILPENIKNWLQGYSEEIKYLREQSYESTGENTTPIATSVSPLLGNIAWNQDSPYNNQCPLYAPNTRCATGCAATAMAQILYYHRWPLEGSGSHTYSPSILSGKELTANFGETAYEWETMQPSYTSASTSESKDAVANLMLQCGIAIDMDYGQESGAVSKKWCYALQNYFNYDQGVAYRNRSYYGIEEWEKIIRAELDNSRLVYVTGFSSSGGHAFVCDGYDTEGLFHINWGWGAMSNGYFRTTALTPATQGIGGSNGGFNYRQSIITGIQRPQTNSIKNIELVSTEALKATPSSIAKTDKTTIKLTGKVKNDGWEPVICDFGIAAFDSSGLQVLELAGDTNISIKDSASVYGFTLSNIDFSTLSDGTYTLHPVCRISGTSAWQPIHSLYVGSPNYLNVKVSNNTIKFSTQGYYSLSVSNITLNSKVYASTPATINAKIKNTGSTEYFGDVKITLYNKDTKKKVVDGNNYRIDLIAGDSTIISFKDEFDVAAGEYLMAITDDDYLKLNSYVSLQIHEAPTEDAVISASSKLSFPDNDKVLYNDMKLHAELTCSQGIYSGYIYPYIYSEDGTVLIGCLDPQLVTVEANDTVDIVFTGVLENGISGSKYLIYLADGVNNAYVTPKEYAQCYFTLFNPLSGVSSISTDSPDYKIYPNPATSIVSIQGSSPIKQISIYATNGSLVMDKKYNSTSNATINIASLTQGQYIICVFGEQAKTTKNFIKK